MNFERSYLTTVSPDDLAEALADHFRSQDFEAKVSSTPPRTLR